MRVDGPLSVGEAARRIVAALAALPAEEVPLRESAGRVLARDVTSPVTLPPWDNAGMDGYAVRAADVAGASADAPVTLPVLETVAAGSRPTRRVEPGTATRIMTGAPVPEGADTVVRVEDTDAGADRVTITSGRDAGRNVRPAGEDLRAGAVAVPAGTTIGPAQLGVLASVGAAQVAVHRAPRVALLSTGDELVDVDRFAEVLAGSRIVSSNSYTLWAALRAAGASVLDLGLAVDDRAQLVALLRQASGCDLVITTGGISAGAFDYTRDVVRELGGTLDFHRVRMRPGAPVGFGRIGDTPWIGLPGNPVSAMVTFELFVRPAIRTLRGERLPFPRALPAVFDDEVTLAAPLTHFFRVTTRTDADGTLRARLTGAQGSGLLTSMARADALLIVPADRAGLVRGDRCELLPLGDAALLASEPPAA